jgi:hypothetical protein
VRGGVPRGQAQRVPRAHPDPAQGHAAHPRWPPRRRHGAHWVREDRRIPDTHAAAPSPPGLRQGGPLAHPLPHARPCDADAQVHQPARQVHRCVSRAVLMPFVVMHIHRFTCCLFSCRTANYVVPYSCCIVLLSRCIPAVFLVLTCDKTDSPV